jgi:hypothetical protein
MAKKDDREIIHGIRTMLPPQEGHRVAQSQTFASGMEDELAAAFTQAELNKMLERGDITGNWKSTKGKPAATTGAKESAK